MALMEERKMAIYLCRWMNGDISIVSASSKDDAILKLDEFASPDDGEIFKLDEFLVDFTLTDDGSLELNYKAGAAGFGERTFEEIMAKAYPALNNCQNELADMDEDSPEYKREIQEAVKTERERMCRGMEIVTTPVPEGIREKWAEIFQVEAPEKADGSK
jgi:hypothetical protein